MLLDTTESDSGKFFVLTNEVYGNLPFSTKEGGSNKYDPSDNTNIAYKLNNGALESANGLGRTMTGANLIIPKNMWTYIEEHEWDTEAGYAVSEPMPAYSVTCKIGLLSKAELSKYYREFGWIVASSGELNNRGWWLRSRFERAVPEISSYEALLRNTQATPQTTPENFYAGVRALNEMIADNGATTVLYQTMEHKNGSSGYTFEKGSEILHREYAKMAQECGGILVPAGDAWVKLREQYPELAESGLWHDDESHPQYRGSYMNACVFYATLFNESPVGLEYDTAKMTESEARIIQTIAAQVCGIGQ